MVRTKNLKSLLRMPLLVLPFFFACASGSGKPTATANDAESGETAEAEGASEASSETSEKPETASDEASEKKADAKPDKKADDEAGGAEAAPKDDSRTTASCEKVIKDNRPAFKKCYKGRTELKGTVVLQIELDAAGKIKKAYIDEESTIKDQKVYDCILDLAKTLKYPSSTKGLDKNFEYEFGINNG